MSTDDGIDVMRAKMARGQRTPPAPPRSRRPDTTPACDTDGGDAGETPRATGASPPLTPVSVAEERATQSVARRISLRPNDAHVNLAIRVRRPLDDQLVEVLHRLRQTSAARKWN